MHSELPAVIIDELGVPRFDGRTAEERMDELDAPIECRFFDDDREATGLVRAGHREGLWRYLIRGGEGQFQVSFVADRAVAPPADWNERDWPSTGTNPERHGRKRELLEIVLREYRRPEDIERIYPLLLPLTDGNSIPIVLTLRAALGVSLNDAKMGLSDACDRAGSRRF